VPAEPVDPAVNLTLADLASVTDEVVAQPAVGQLAGALDSALPARARVPEALLAPLLAALWQRRRGEERAGLAVLVDDDETAREVADEAAWYAPADEVGFVPSRGVTYGSGLEPAPHLVGERARGLGLLKTGGLVAISAAALVERIPPPERRATALHVESGGELVRDEAVAALVAAGYTRVERVGDRGDLAVRGDILDVFPTTGAEPVRIELFGDEVERISRFSVFTQRSLAELQRSDLQPAREALRSPADVEEWTHEEDVPIPNDLVALAPELLAHGVLCAWQPERVLEAARDRLAEAAASHSRSARERAYAGEASVLELVEGSTALDPLQGDAPSFEAQRPALAGRGISEAEAELLGLVRTGLRVVVAFPHRGDAERTQLALRRVEATLLGPGQPLPDEAGVVFVVSPLRRGLVWQAGRVAVVSAQQLFRRRAAGAAVAGRLGRALSSAADLRPGDYVVHVDHGVGRFLGFDTKTVGGVTRDYVNLQFKGEDKLFVPHDQLAKLSRYIGADGRAPALSRLGGKAWHTLRSRARAAVHDLAGELLRLYAVRQTRTRPPYSDEEGWLERLERAFPYSETEDQGRAIDEVFEDLTGEQPMDRLICGDVGFGKTEVAMRAAFLVAISGRQVLVLAPTTLLVQQHLQTFRDRFRDFPVRVEAVSRMREAGDVKQALRAFSEGRIEVLIGTHRLLSRDVLPKQLGLIVVDEEQRFGVRQKELLRQVRLEVDALSLSATPIPRTLHMSLAGLRDISVIATPPRGRQPIRTHVAEYDEVLVAAALRRELAREGQVFYLHNRVETIYEAAEKLRRLVPEARIGVGHGQMDDRALEQAMVEFLRGDLDVLVATTIIESGLDIPQVNTLIIERADMLGMAQLYQIRGRVGRGESAAHAYLMYPDGSELSEEARARLAALADYTELGSGYRVALRDLELRGAGSLLGDEQSGHVAAVGFELYCDLLAEAVAELSGNRAALMRPVRLDLALDAYVPADYVAYEAAKLDVHRRIALSESVDELRDIEIELGDRFGEPPEPVENLILAQEARIKLAALGADSLTVRGARATIARVALGPADLRELRERHGRVLYNAAASELAVPLAPERPLAQVIAVVNSLGDLVKAR
jgi:transcription-repair coupling factor (superfamily II helicase)